MTDRKIDVNGKEQVTATIEAQIKAQKDVLKDLPFLFEALERLRRDNETEEINIKGKQEMPGIMKRKFEGQT